MSDGPTPDEVLYALHEVYGTFGSLRELSAEFEEGFAIGRGYLSDGPSPEVMGEVRRRIQKELRKRASTEEPNAEPGGGG